MLDKKVLFVSDKETFIIKSIMKKVEARGVECQFSILDINCLTKIKEKIGPLVYLYIDEKNDLNTNGINYLRDLCMDKDYELFLIGYQDALDELREGPLQGAIAGEFVRPVNAGQLAEVILAEVYKEATVGHKKHILVVDDSGMMLSTIKSWLEDKYRITPVNSALNAITFLSKEKPDLILLDYEMPACSGPKFLEMIRSDPDCSSIPVIFLTGRDDADSVRSVLSLKPAGYLLKSLPKEKIVEEVDAFFAKRKG